MAEGTKVLFVDDEEGILDLYRIMCENKYNVETLSQGTRAVEEFDNSIDIAFFDRRMPDMSGYEVIKKIQNEGYETPMIIISGSDEDESPTDADYKEYLKKPIDQDEIFNAIDEYA